MACHRRIEEWPSDWRGSSTAAVLALALTLALALALALEVELALALAPTDGREGRHDRAVALRDFSRGAECACGLGQQGSAAPPEGGPRKGLARGLSNPAWPLEIRPRSSDIRVDATASTFKET